MPEEADHFGVRGRADEGHVAVSEGAVDLQVEAGFGGGVPVLTQGLHSVCRQVKVEVMGTDLRSGHLKSEMRKIMPDVHVRHHTILQFLTYKAEHLYLLGC